MPRELLDLPYRDGTNLPDDQQRRIRLDLYRPDGEPPRGGWPLLLWLHGGGLIQGDKTDQTHLARCLCAQGLIVAMANYRQSPAARYPQYVHDAAHAAAWLLRHATEHEGNPDRLTVAGHSAGAYLAAMVGTHPDILHEHGLTQRLASLVLVSGQMFTHFTVRGERGVPDATTRPTIDDAAPCYHAGPHVPPTLLLVAQHDLPCRLEENRCFQALLQSHGVTAQLHCVADRDHGSIVRQMVQPGDASCRRLTTFAQQFAARAESQGKPENL